jgi:hypothetical protein
VLVPALPLVEALMLTPLPQAVNSAARSTPDAKPTIAFVARAMHPPECKMSATRKGSLVHCLLAISASYRRHENLL